MLPSKLLLRGSVAASILAGAYLIIAPGGESKEGPPASTMEAPAGEPIGVFTTLPLIWSEETDLAQELSTDQPVHWVKDALAREGAVTALDTLTPDSIGALERLVLAQPRALAGAENVALDDWVRNGGRVLVFADPMLTEHSELPLGDPRRPQDVILLSPILERWGLQLTYDPDQPDADRIGALNGAPLVTRNSGRLSNTGDGTDTDCEIRSEGLIARCTIGGGVAVVMADAAMLEAERDPSEGALMLRNLTRLTWGKS